MGLTTTRAHLDDEHGALGELGGRLETQGVQREATASLSLAQSFLEAPTGGRTQSLETDSLAFVWLCDLGQMTSLL